MFADTASLLSCEDKSVAPEDLGILKLQTLILELLDRVVKVFESGLRGPRFNSR